MKKSTFNQLGSKSRIGISVDSDSLESTNDDEGKLGYGSFPLKRLSKTNSFIIIDEVFYIGKIKPNGSDSHGYNVYRTSDMRHIASSSKSKEETIEIVKRKYIELDE